jgi:Golgi apparatus protein 1
MADKPRRLPAPPRPADERGGVHECLRANRDKLSEACRREELLLEAQQAEHIELRPNLLAACGNERTMFCRDVKAGSGRVFRWAARGAGRRGAGLSAAHPRAVSVRPRGPARTTAESKPATEPASTPNPQTPAPPRRCLADHLADPDLGPVCRGQVISKIQRRQANWRLDPPLRKACRADVAAKCKGEDDQVAESGLVYRCLIGHADSLQPACRKELGRAVHMALYVWIPGSIITQRCDVDIANVCLKDRPNMLHDTGTISKCLADAVRLSRGWGGV